MTEPKKKKLTTFQKPLQDPEQVQFLVDEYFETRSRTRKIKQHQHGKTIEFEEEYKLPPTMAGLANHLSTTRMTIWRYMQKGEEGFVCYSIIARAMERIAEFAEEALYTKEGVTGARFSLEINHRYGKEDEKGSSGGFQQTIIAPAESEGGGVVAIPKWGDEEEDE